MDSAVAFTMKESFCFHGFLYSTERRYNYLTMKFQKRITEGFAQITKVLMDLERKVTEFISEFNVENFIENYQFESELAIGILAVLIIFYTCYKVS